MTKAEEDLRVRLGSVSVDCMNGDNLAILLCSHFEDVDEEVEDETGWTPSAIAGCEEVLTAIHAHYAPLIRRLQAELESARSPEVSDDDIIVLYQQGKTLDAIAEAVGLTKSAVHARLKKRGLTTSRKRVNWTPVMRAKLVTLRASGTAMTEIAKCLKVSRSAIYAELRRMGPR